MLWPQILWWFLDLVLIVTYNKWRVQIHESDNGPHRDDLLPCCNRSLKTRADFIYPFLISKLQCNNNVSLVFSSPELKAQVSFSDRLSSVVCLSVRPSVCKLFTFSSSSPEPLGQFQPNLAQSIPGWRGFKFVKMKGHTLSKGEIIWK